MKWMNQPCLYKTNKSIQSVAFQDEVQCLRNESSENATLGFSMSHLKPLFCRLTGG